MNEQDQNVVSKTITDKIMDKLHSILNQMGGLINPWLWSAVLLVILIGQSWAVKIFVMLALGISVYFRWFHKPRNITSNNHDGVDNETV